MKLVQFLYVTETGRLQQPKYLKWKWKMKNDLSPEFASEIFVRETESYYSLKRRNGFRIPLIRIVYHLLFRT